MKKRVLVAWSGGVDSTAMMVDYLAKGYSVDAIYTRIQNNSDKMAVEEKAIEIMYARYFRNYAVRLLGNNSVTMGAPGGKVLFNQVPAFMYSLITTLSEGYDEVAIGYVMNDDAVSFLDEIRTIWNSYAGIIGIPLPPLVFPMTKHKKHSLYSNLPDVLRKYVVWCEWPNKGKRCDECPPCLRMIALGLQTKRLKQNKQTKEKT